MNLTSRLILVVAMLAAALPTPSAALEEKSLATYSREIWTTRVGNVGRNNGPQYPGARSTPNWAFSGGLSSM